MIEVDVAPYLQAAASALAAVYNGILTYEAYETRRTLWKILGSGLTTLFLAYLAYHRLWG